MIEARLAEKSRLFDKNAALQWAVDTFRRNAHDLKPGSRPGRAPLNVKYQREGQRESIEFGYPEHSELVHDDEISSMVQNARQGDEQAGHFLSETAARLIEQGDPLPAPLREFAAEALRHQRPGRRHGRNRFDLMSRNQVICFVVAAIGLRWGFSATRNEASEHASAVSIAQEALQRVGINLGEDALAKIWNGSGCRGRRKQSRAFK